MKHSCALLILTLVFSGQVSVANEEQNTPSVQPNATQAETGEQASVDPEATRVPSAPAKGAGDKHDDGASDDQDPQLHETRSALIAFFEIIDPQWIMAIISFLALLISAWAVWLLKATLSATHEAVKQAEIAGIAAQKAVKVTRQIGQAQIAAYLDCTCRCNLHDPGLRSDNITLNFKIKNWGQTPASGVKLKFVSRAYESADPIWIDTEMREFDISNNLSPGNEMEFFPTVTLSSGAREQLVSEARTLGVKGSVQWKTVFGSVKSVEFEYYSTGGLIEKGLMLTDWRFVRMGRDNKRDSQK